MSHIKWSKKVEQVCRRDAKKTYDDHMRHFNRVYQRFKLSLGKSIDMINYESLLMGAMIFRAALSLTDIDLRLKTNHYS